MANKRPAKTLPAKEAGLFRSILKFYERKQYKKGLKAAEQILSKFPEHGETLAMKGLTLNCMDRKTEAYELVKKGIKFDITSHVCWHVLGLLYRSDRDYVEASKCYNTALRHDKENIQILRDLSLLQIQLRDLEGYKETRQTLVRLKPKQKNNWIAYAIAAHLCRDYQGSQAALDLEEKPEQVEYEYSEILLYRNMIIEESGQLQAALNHLDESKPMILDLLSWQEKRAELLLRLEKWEEAKAEYHSLLQINSEHYDYINGYLRAHSLPAFVAVPKPSPTPSRTPATLLDESHEQFAILKYVLTTLAAEFPTSYTIRELPLLFYSGDRFRDAMKEYLRKGFIKGSPALFTASKWLYTSPAKVGIIEDLVLSIVQSLETTQIFPGADEKSPPSVWVWAIFYLAQHYDSQGDLNKAFHYIDKAIQHTPTVIDLYCTKAKFLKHAGNLKAASDMYEKARELDLADRYLNTKSTLYCLRSDQVEKADSVISLFTRDGDNSQTNLFDMQCMWYERESADSFTRTGDYGKALKKYKAILTHFADIAEDQFDFHTYCLRKMTLRAYVKLLRFEDQLYSHRNHLAAIRGLVNIYLILHAKPKHEEKEEEDPSLANLSAQDRKKAESKKRRAEARAKQKQAEENAKNEKLSQKDKQKNKNPQEDDVNGEKLLNVEDKLAEASKYLQSVRGFAQNDIGTQHLAFQLYMIRKKYLLALQALKTSIHLDADHPQTHKDRVQFLREVDPEAEKEKVVGEVLREEKQALLGSYSSPQELNTAYISNHKNTVLPTLAGAEVQFALDPTQKAEALKLVEGIAQSPDLHKHLQGCITVHKSVLSTFNDQELAQKLYTQFQPHFSKSTYFHPPSSDPKPPLEEQKPEAPSQPNP